MILGNLVECSVYAFVFACYVSHCTNCWFYNCWLCGLKGIGFLITNSIGADAGSS